MMNARYRGLWRRGLCLLLALIMTAGLMPGALAAEEAENEATAAEVGMTEAEVEMTDAAVPLAEVSTAAFQGDGSAANPYKISNETDLRALADEVNAAKATYYADKYFLQTADITLGSAEWLSIGKEVGYYFAGNYDGGGHYINFGTISRTDGPSTAGLIGCTEGGSVKNVTIKGSYTNTYNSSTRRYGGVVCYASNTAIENCVNEMSITAHGGAGIGGIVGELSGAKSYIDGCTNKGVITTTNGVSGGGTGGIVGKVSGLNKDNGIRNCMNTGNISYGGSFSSYAYLGGIVGYNGGMNGLIVENCGNTGNISGTNKISTSGFAGGIFGASSSYSITLRRCYNAGNITVNLGYVGGIVAKVGAANSRVEDCVNYGAVDNQYNGYGTTGGIIGDISTDTCYAENCLNIGAVTVLSTATSMKGYAFVGSFYSWDNTSPNFYKNNHYLASSCANGGSAKGEQPGAYDPFETYTAELVGKLGSSYVADKNGVMGANKLLPILAWTDPLATFGANFVITDGHTGKEIENAGCGITVKNSAGQSVANYSEGMSNGTYSYTVTKDNYVTVNSNFTVNKGNAKVLVTLNPTPYSYQLTVSPADAIVTLANADKNVGEAGTVAPVTAEKGVYTYTLFKAYGDYTWNIKKYGFMPQEKTLTAAQVSAAASTVTLAVSPAKTVTFRVKDGDAAVTDAVIAVKSVDYDQTMEAESQGVYKLSAGKYSYVARKRGYDPAVGEFTVAAENLTLNVALPKAGPWDGSTVDTSWYDKDAATLYISTAAELAGLAAITSGSGKDTFDGAYEKVTLKNQTVCLTADINLNNKPWTPIANTKGSSTSASTAFSGVFDGQNHAVTGLYIPNDFTTTSDDDYNRGLFSYIEGGTVKNLKLTVDISFDRTQMGGVAAMATSARFENITVSGSMTSGTNYGSYVGGILGQGKTETTILNCTNNAAITVNYKTGAYIAGIVGQAVKPDISGCVNNGDITGGYQVAGIVGTTYTTAGTIARCINNGKITSKNDSSTKSYTVGGILGCLYKADTVTDCVNHGDVIGAGPTAGGIVGYHYNSTSSAPYSTIVNCYNTGAVSSTYSSGYAGGILGAAYVPSYGSTVYYCDIQNCYNTGKVTATDNATSYAGGIIGYWSGAAKLAESTEHIANNHYLDGTAAKGLGNETAAVEAATKTFAAGAGYAALITALGDGYCADLAGDKAVNGGYPILRWQDPNAVFVVKITVATDNDKNDDGKGANIVLRDAQGNTVAPASTAEGVSYNLKNGDYSYAVTKRGYVCKDGSASGSFRIAGAGVTKEVNLEAEKYVWTVTVTPKDADFALKQGDAAVAADETSESKDGKSKTYTYKLYNGSYSYAASKFGYVEDVSQSAVTGAFTVAYAGGSRTVALKQDAEGMGRLTIEVRTHDNRPVGESGDGVVVPAIEISAKSDPDYPGRRLYQGSSANALRFPAGTYTYTVKAAGYGKAEGEVTVTAGAASLAKVSVTLQANTGWDGTEADTAWYDDTKTTFDLYTEAELAGLSKLVSDGKTFEGKTVNLKADMNLGDNAWKPIGVYSTTAANARYFMGTFDGNGCSVFIDKGNFGANGFSTGFGLFAAIKGTSATKRAVVKNLIMYGNVSADTAAYTYLGGVAGYATNTKFINVSNRMNITVRVVTTEMGFIDLGGICGWSVYNDFESCSNTGNISGSMKAGEGKNAMCYVGGLAGFTTQASSSSPFIITDCYNSGSISSAGGTTTYAGGLVGNGGNQSYADMANCYNSGIVSTGCPMLGNGAFTGEYTYNNYYLNTTRGEGAAAPAYATAKTSEELKTLASTLGAKYKNSSTYPLLYWEAAPHHITVGTMPAKTAYNDREAFVQTGMTLRLHYTADDAGTEVASGWQVIDGACLGASQTEVTVSYMGVSCKVPVTVTQVKHDITAADLKLELAAPKAGELPQTELRGLSEKLSGGSVTWYANGRQMAVGETFRAGVYYRAAVRLAARYEDGVVWYNFAADAEPAVEGCYELLYRARSNENKNLGFTLTYGVNGSFTDNASHSYYAGDTQVAADYAQYLEERLTVTVGTDSRSFTVAEIEQYALDGAGLEKVYSAQELNSRVNYRMSGIPLYRFLLEKFPQLGKASDESELTVGTVSLTLGELRTTGSSYDKGNKELENKLPYLLAFGVDGKPCTAANGPLYLAAPAKNAGDENANRFEKSVAQITVNAVTAATFTVRFAAKDKDNRTVSTATVVITDGYGNTAYSGKLSSVTLKKGEKYTYELTAPGYNVRSGEITGAGTITERLQKVWDGSSFTQPKQDADGTWLIYTAEELMWFNREATQVSVERSKEMMGADVRLMADIDMSGVGKAWIPMGSLGAGSVLYLYVVDPELPKIYGGGAYTGTFDGNGHTIWNMNIDWENHMDLEEAWDGSVMMYSYRLGWIGGLFGDLKNGGTVKDLGLTGSVRVLDRPDSSIADFFMMGGIAGWAESGSAITGCYADVDLEYKIEAKPTNHFGYSSAGFPEHCDLYIGGIVGSLSAVNEPVKVENCYATGDMIGGGVRSIRAGGIVGATRNGVTSISKCYATGKIDMAPSYFDEIGSIPTYVGGIVGGINVSPLSSDNSTVSYCLALNPSLTISYADGAYPSFTHANRVIGQENFAEHNGTAEYNLGLADMQLNGAAYSQEEDEQSYRSASGRSVVAERAYSAQTYTNIKWNGEGNVWKFTDNAYPMFAWQKLPAQSGSSGSRPTVPVELPAPQDKPVPGEAKFDKIVWTPPAESAAEKFTDCEPTKWYNSCTSFVVANGLFAGVSKTQFAPEAHMTRAMFITVVARAETLLGGSTEGFSSDFDDFASDAWYAQSVAWGAKAGVIGGVGGSNFAPNQEITREQLISMLYRYAEFRKMSVESGDEAHSFADGDSISSYAKPAVQWAFENGLLNGKDGNRMDPQGVATRAEVAAVIYRFLSFAAGTEVK